MTTNETRYSRPCQVCREPLYFDGTTHYCKGNPDAARLAAAKARREAQEVICPVCYRPAGTRHNCPMRAWRGGQPFRRIA